MAVGVQEGKRSAQGNKQNRKNPKEIGCMYGKQWCKQEKKKVSSKLRPKVFNSETPRGCTNFTSFYHLCIQRLGDPASEQKPKGTQPAAANRMATLDAGAVSGHGTRLYPSLLFSTREREASPPSSPCQNQGVAKSHRQPPPLVPPLGELLPQSRSSLGQLLLATPAASVGRLATAQPRRSHCTHPCHHRRFSSSPLEGFFSSL